MSEEHKTSQDDESSGGQGGVLSDPHHVRADARMAARLISLGVVSDEEISKLLRKGLKLAGRLAAADKGRDFAAVMGVYLAAARLELDAKASNEPGRQSAISSGVFINVHGGSGGVDIRSDLLNDGDYLEFQRQRALAVDADSSPVRESGERRQMEDGAAPGGAGPVGGSGGNGQTNGHHH